MYISLACRLGNTHSHLFFGAWLVVTCTLYLLFMIPMKYKIFSLQEDHWCQVILCKNDRISMSDSVPTIKYHNPTALIVKV